MFEFIGTYFAHILFTLVLVTGFLALYGKLTKSRSGLVDFGRSLFPVFFLVFVLRSFIVEPFRIPSGSMLPNLEIGDFLLVSKYSYGLRFPIGNKKFLDVGDPKRGDVVVFKYPKDTRVNYIKRVIGLPGDKISYRNKKLTINAKPVPIENTGQIYLPTGAEIWQETIGDIENDILIYSRAPQRFSDQEITVPKGHYFVLGDNRDNSGDSRVWGFVPEENLVGKAFFIWMSLNIGPGSEGQPLVDWKRFGNSVE